MAWYDNVMIAYGVCEEVAGVLRRNAEGNLRAAEVVLIAVGDEFALGDEAAGQVAGDLENGHRPLREMAVYADADAGFEVGVECAFADDVKRNGAVREQNLSAPRVDAGRIGLEAGMAGEEDALSLIERQDTLMYTSPG